MSVAVFVGVRVLVGVAVAGARVGVLVGRGVDDDAGPSVDNAGLAPFAPSLGLGVFVARAVGCTGRKSLSRRGSNASRCWGPLTGPKKLTNSRSEISFDLTRHLQYLCARVLSARACDVNTLFLLPWQALQA